MIKNYRENRWTQESTIQLRNEPSTIDPVHPRIQMRAEIKPEMSRLLPITPWWWTSYLFNYRQHITNFKPEDLWTHPKEVANFLNLERTDGDLVTMMNECRLNLTTNNLNKYVFSIHCCCGSFIYSFTGGYCVTLWIMVAFQVIVLLYLFEAWWKGCWFPDADPLELWQGQSGIGNVLQS